MKFEFSIRKALKQSWQLFKTAPWFFVGLTFIMLVVNAAGGENIPLAISLLALIVGFVVSYMWTSVALATVDNKTSCIGFGALKGHLPTMRGFLTYIGVAIATTALSALALIPFVILGVYLMTLFTTGMYVILGALPFVIPGAYIAIRLSFANNAYVDRKGSVGQSLRYSWKMTRGDAFWTVVLTGLVSVGLMIGGFLMIGVGFLVTYPLSVILMMTLYRSLTTHEEHSIIVQPVEIEAPAEIQ